MTVGSTSGIDAFMAARAAASKRLESTSQVAQPRAPRLTAPPTASDNVAGSQPSKAPVKGQYIDVLA